MPDYWRVLAAPVPREKGLPHILNVRISEIQAAGAQRAFAVSSYAEAPLRDFEFRNVRIDAKTAGTIQNAENWKFEGVRIRAADGSVVEVKESQGVTGLEGKAEK